MTTAGPQQSARQRLWPGAPIGGWRRLAAIMTQHFSGREAAAGDQRRAVSAENCAGVIMPGFLGSVVIFGLSSTRPAWAQSPHYRPLSPLHPGIRRPAFDRAGAGEWGEDEEGEEEEDGEEEEGFAQAQGHPYFQWDLIAARDGMAR